MQLQAKTDMSTRKYLIVGPAWVGDMVMAQTLFQFIQSTYPGAAIHVFAPAWTQPLLRFMPQVTQGLVSPFAHGELRLRERYQLGVKLRAAEYTHAIVLPNAYKAALVPFWANIPVRTGWVGEMRYGLLTDARKLDKQKYPLMIQRFAALALPRGAQVGEKLPRPRFHVPRSQFLNVCTEKNIAVSDKPILAMCPGAEFGPSKRWSPAHFATVAQAKLDAGWDVWLFGSPKDQPVAEAIQSRVAHRCRNVVGRTSLSEAVILLSGAQRLLTNDSGLMHVGCALDVPVVAVYGSSSPQFTPPLSLEAKVLSAGAACSPCFKRECPLSHHRCMEDLSPEQVLSVL